MSTDDIQATENVQQRLESTYEEYQQQHRYEKLDEVAGQMETILLQQALANALFDDSLAVDSETVDRVREIREQVAQNDLNALTDETIETLEAELATAERQLNEAIQERRMERLETVEAFVELNDTLEFMDDSRLSALQHILDNWEWESMVVTDDATVGETLDDAAETGEVMATVYRDAQRALGEEFSGTQIQDIVDQLLNQRSLPVESLGSEEVQALSESVVGPYLQLTLGDPE